MNNRPPNWERDEIELVLAFGHKMHWPPTLSEDNPEVIRLSKLLRGHRNIADDDTSNKTRNPAGVVRKYADLYSQIPGKTLSTTKGGQLTKQIMKEYLEDPDNFSHINLDTRQH